MVKKILQAVACVLLVIVFTPFVLFGAFIGLAFLAVIAGAVCGMHLLCEAGDRTSRKRK